MKRKLVWLCLLIMPLTLFYACNNQAEKDQKLLAELLDESQIDSLSDEGDYGQTVHIDDVKPCVELYIREMNKHGFTNTVEPANIVLTQTQMITTEESFRGRELLSFLRKAAGRRAVIGGGRKTKVKIVFGMYTEDYLSKYAPNNETMRNRKRNRIAVFLVTCDWNEATKRYEFAKEEGDDENAFDFGGLQP